MDKSPGSGQWTLESWRHTKVLGFTTTLSPGLWRQTRTPVHQRLQSHCLGPNPIDKFAHFMISWVTICPTFYLSVLLFQSFEDGNISNYLMSYLLFVGMPHWFIALTLFFACLCFCIFSASCVLSTLYIVHYNTILVQVASGRLCFLSSADLRSGPPNNPILPH